MAFFFSPGSDHVCMPLSMPLATGGAGRMDGTGAELGGVVSLAVPTVPEMHLFPPALLNLPLVPLPFRSDLVKFLTDKRTIGRNFNRTSYVSPDHCLTYHSGCCYCRRPSVASSAA
jgi:hypothetical protein